MAITRCVVAWKDVVVSDEVIEMESGVSHRDGHPFVNLSWGSMKGQLTAAEARMHALHLLECAEGAETDAMVLTMFRKLWGDKEDADEMAMMMIHLLREGRSEKWNQTGK